MNYLRRVRAVATELGEFTAAELFDKLLAANTPGIGNQFTYHGLVKILGRSKNAEQVGWGCGSRGPRTVKKYRWLWNEKLMDTGDKTMRQKKKTTAKATNCEHQRTKGRILFDGLTRRYASPDFKTFSLEWFCPSCHRVFGGGGPWPRSELGVELQRQNAEKGL